MYIYVSVYICMCVLRYAICRKHLFIALVSHTSFQKEINTCVCACVCVDAYIYIYIFIRIYTFFLHPLLYMHLMSKPNLRASNFTYLLYVSYSATLHIPSVCSSYTQRFHFLSKAD